MSLHFVTCRYIALNWFPEAEEAALKAEEAVASGVCNAHAAEQAQICLFGRWHVFIGR